jgi:hypothetical protein
MSIAFSAWSVLVVFLDLAKIEIIDAWMMSFPDDINVIVPTCLFQPQYRNDPSSRNPTVDKKTRSDDIEFPVLYSQFPLAWYCMMSQLRPNPFDIYCTILFDTYYP